MSETPRLVKLKEMTAKFPDDPRARYFLAHELFRAEDWEGAAAEYDAYVRLAPGDEGAALKAWDCATSAWAACRPRPRPTGAASRTRWRTATTGWLRSSGFS